jgi:hypothetical protein
MASNLPGSRLRREDIYIDFQNAARVFILNPQALHSGSSPVFFNVLLYVINRLGDKAGHEPR